MSSLKSLPQFFLKLSFGFYRRSHEGKTVALSSTFGDVFYGCKTLWKHFTVLTNIINIFFHFCKVNVNGFWVAEHGVSLWSFLYASRKRKTGSYNLC
jgi:hypothetical protein